MLDRLIELTTERIVSSYPKRLQQAAARSSTPQKLEIIVDAMSKDMPESKNAIGEFADEIGEVRKARNDIMHKIWRRSDTEEARELVDLRLGEPEQSVRRVTPSGMRELANKMIDLTFELADWKMRHAQILRRRFARSVGVRPSFPQLPAPPRVSARDRRSR
jgi:tryptophan 2,3-dioxygenase